MSRKQDDFVFCGSRVRVTPEALLVSEEFAASSLAPMELCGTPRSPETMLTYSEHREYRSLLGKLQRLQLQPRPDLSYDVNRVAQRSSAPTVADARALNAISVKPQRSSENHLEISTGSDQCVHGSAGFCVETPLSPTWKVRRVSAASSCFLTHEPRSFLAWEFPARTPGFTGRAAQ